MIKLVIYNSENSIYLNVSFNKEELNKELLFEIENFRNYKYSIPLLINHSSYQKLQEKFVDLKSIFSFKEIINFTNINCIDLNYYDNILCKILSNENTDNFKIERSLEKKLNNSVGIIIRQWDSCDYTSNCILSLSKIQNNNLQIYLLDDASIDDSFIKIAFRFNNINLIRFINRQEYTRVLNIGAEVAVNDGFNYLYFTNNDTKDFVSKTNKDYFSNLLDIFNSNTNIALVSPKVMDWDGNEFETRTSIKLGYVFDIATEAYIVSADVWKKVNGFDNGLIRYCEDIMLIQKIKKLNYQVTISSNSLFRHYGMGSSKKQVFIPTFYRIRNGIMILKINYSILNPQFYFFIYKWLKPHFKLIKQEFKSKMFLRASSRFIILIYSYLIGLFSLYKANKSWRSSKEILTSNSIKILNFDRFFEKRYISNM